MNAIIAAVNVAMDSLCSIVIIMLLLSLEKRSREKESRYFLGMTVTLLLILLSDLADWLTLGVPAYRTLSYVSNSINYSAGYVIIGYFIRYLGEFMTEQKKLMGKIIFIFDGLCILSVLATLLNLPFGFFFSIDDGGMYWRGAFYWLSQLYPAVSLLISAILICTSRDLTGRERIVFFTYPVFPLIGISIDYFVHGLTLTYTGAFLCVIVIYFQIHARRGQEIAQKETELTKSRVSIMLSQIQPHFLYNSLTAIYTLCDIDPAAAKTAVGEFSEYLRGNLDSLKLECPVPFETELRHIETYLKLEKMRFRDELTIVYDIKTTGFMVPALTVQPLIENAVKYGVGQAEDGGTVTLATRELDDRFEITVSDDGVGFDPYEKQADGRTHIGIDNVVSRLWEMSRATLVITSEKGVGTTAVITVPKGATE